MFRIVLFAASVSAATLLGVSAHSTSPEARQRQFLILNDDGYGTSDCLAKASACGKIVADAWCESKGFAKSASYRPAQADDMTQTVFTGRSALNETFVISCSE